MRRAALVVIVGLLLSLGLYPASAQSELDQARAELADAESRITELQTEADEATAAFHEAESDLGRIELDIDLLVDEVAVVESDVADLELELAKVAIQQYTGVAAAGELEAVSRPDVNESARAEFLVDLATGASTDVLDDYRAATARLANRQAALSDARLEQESTLEDLGSAQDTIYSSLEDMQTERDRISGVVAGLEAEERARIQAEIAAAQAAAAATAPPPAQAPAGDAPAAPGETTPPSDTTAPGEPPATVAPGDPPATVAPTAPPPPPPAPVGGMLCPVAGPTSFTDTWGAPRGNGRTHKGVDMMAASGTPVVNPVSGAVEHRGNSSGGL
ncbi:MAG: hypothetical protein OES57_12670, partial [Acidimicrobiia bacterium]|nr:hypothetical protein [Acidimicrobiia bacterium]